MLGDYLRQLRDRASTTSCPSCTTGRRARSSRSRRRAPASRRRRPHARRQLARRLLRDRHGRAPRLPRGAAQSRRASAPRTSHATWARRRNLYTGEAFELTTRARRRPARRSIAARITRPERYWLFVETGDEVLDYREAVDYYAGALHDGGARAATTRWSRSTSTCPTSCEWASANEAGPVRGGRRLPRRDDPRGSGRLLPGRGRARQALEGEGGDDPAALRQPGAQRAACPRRRSSPRTSTRSSSGRCAARDEFGFEALARDYYGHAPTPVEADRGGAAAAREPDLLLQARQGPLPGGAGGEPQGRARRRGEEAQAAGAGRRVGRASSPRPRARGHRERSSTRCSSSPTRWRSSGGARPGRHRRRARAPARLLDARRARRAGGLLPAPLRVRVLPARAPASRTSPPLAEPEGLPDADARAPSRSTTTRPPRSTTRSRSSAWPTAPCASACTSPRPRSSSGATTRSRPWRASGCPRPTSRAARSRCCPRPRSPRPRSPRAGACPPPRSTSRSTPATLESPPPIRAWSACEIADNLRIGELEHAPERGGGRRRPRRGRARRRPAAPLARSPQRCKAARGAAEEKGDRARLHDPRRRRPRGDRAAPARHAHRHARRRADDPRERHVGAPARRPGPAPRSTATSAASRRAWRSSPAAHEWLGVSHYAWSSSPLRRFSDLANQRQLVAALRHEPPAVLEEELADGGARLRDGLRGLRRAPAHAGALLGAAVPPAGGPRGGRCVRDPRRAGAHRRPAAGVPRDRPAARRRPGDKVRVAFGEPDLWEPIVLCRYAGNR